MVSVYGEISVLFFVFSAETCSALLFDAFVSTQRENMFIFESRDSFLKRFFCFSFISVAVLFFRSKKTSRAAF